MLAFNNDPKLKEFYVNRMKAHAEADEIIQGTGWENGKGCFIGCTLHEYSHESFESEGIGPEWLGKLADTIFEGLPNAKAKQFAVDFYPAMKVGLDLEQVKKDFLIFILEENLKTLDACVYEKEKWPQVTDSIEQTKKAIELSINYQKVQTSAARSAAWSAARSAAWSAGSAARSAESAAESAARSAGSAARSAESAAESAARSALSAARSAESAAESAAFEKYADKLLKLLSGETK